MSWLDSPRENIVDFDVVVKGNHKRIENIKHFFHNGKILIDSRAKQRVVITSFSYAVLSLDEFTVVIEPVHLIGNKDRSFVYEKSSDIKHVIADRFNEYFDKDPRIIHDNIDFLKPIGRST